MSARRVSRKAYTRARTRANPVTRDKTVPLAMMALLRENDADRPGVPAPVRPGGGAEGAGVGAVTAGSLGRATGGPFSGPGSSRGAELDGGRGGAHSRGG